MHCHGGAGGEFGGRPWRVATAARHHHRSGTTTLLGSLVSGSREALVAGVATCAALVAAGDLAGIHLEGPFLSHERRGAQDPAALTDVDPSLLEAPRPRRPPGRAAHALTQMTFAPERPGGDDAPGPARRPRHPPGARPHRRRRRHRVGLAAVGAGAARHGAAAALVTHVFNGMPPLHHRAPGPVAACLAQAARGEAVLEVVGDGVHLDAGTVRMLFDVVGADGICLITDAMAASGMPEGSYALGGRDVVVAGRTARLADGGSIAGGVATLLEVVRWCVHEAGVPLQRRRPSRVPHPARALGLPDVGARWAGLPRRRPRRRRRPGLGSVLRAGHRLG